MTSTKEKTRQPRQRFRAMFNQQINEQAHSEMTSPARQHRAALAYLARIGQ